MASKRINGRQGLDKPSEGHELTPWCGIAEGVKDG